VPPATARAASAVPPVAVPPVFGDLAGQERVVGQLLGALDGGMTHAWLFTGPPGSGRSVAARAFASALLCRDGGCGECASCRQVRAGTHADLLLVRPEGLSYGVKQTRDLVLRAAGAPSGGRWHVVLFEDADRCTEAAANALLKAIEEPAPRTVWLLCAPSAEDLVTTIRSRCRVMTLRVPPSSAVASVLVSRDGVSPAAALAAARAAQGHVGRARRLATDSAAAARRLSVLKVPVSATSLGPALAAAASLVKIAEDEAKAVTGQLDEPEREALRQAFGEGSTGKGVAKAMRGMAGAMKDLEDRQKSRATRVKRDTLDSALLDLVAFYRDVLMLQLGVAVGDGGGGEGGDGGYAGAELFNADRYDDLRRIAVASTPEATLRRIQAIMRCRERLTVNVAPLLAVEEMTISLARG
jgi:DNA polymerase-3 subunit delta'